MRYGFVLLSCVVGVTFAADEKPDPDEKAIAGTWIIESIVDEGKEDETGKGVKFTFKDGNIEVELPNGEKDKYKWGYKVDSSRKPKTINLAFINADVLLVQKGLYSLDKDSLTIRLPAARNGERPASLDAPECMLIKFKRAK